MLEPDRASPVALRLMVSYTGTGIPADKLDRVFERYAGRHILHAPVRGLRFGTHDFEASGGVDGRKNLG